MHAGILVVVAIGVALGIFLGGVLLGIIILYMRRYVDVNFFLLDDCVIVKHWFRSRK